VEGTVRIERLVIPEAGRCEIEEVELGEQLAPDEALVRTRAALLCDGPAVSAFAGRANRPSLPLEAQAGLVGEVVAGGDWPAGSLVACRGGLATHAKTRVVECTALPEDVSEETAAFYAAAQEALSTVRAAPPRLGENVVVLGQGVPGNLTGQIYRLSGAGEVAVADGSAQRLAAAQQCGLEKCFNVSERPLPEWLGELAPRGIELLCVSEEGLSLLPDALPFVAPHGIVALQAVPDEGTAQRLWQLTLERSLAVLGAPGGRITDEQRRADASMLLDWLATGRLWTEPLCTQQLPLAQAQDGLTGLRDEPDEFLGVLLSLGF
jgi:threonine dehydrogenase-like Zn-dependent dehydrogenase